MLLLASLVLKDKAKALCLKVLAEGLRAPKCNVLHHKNPNQATAMHWFQNGELIDSQPQCPVPMADAWDPQMNRTTKTTHYAWRQTKKLHGCKPTEMPSDSMDDNRSNKVMLLSPWLIIEGSHASVIGAENSRVCVWLSINQFTILGTLHFGAQRSSTNTSRHNALALFLPTMLACRSIPLLKHRQNDAESLT